MSFPLLGASGCRELPTVGLPGLESVVDQPDLARRRSDEQLRKGGAFIAQGKLVKAQQAFEKAIDLDPTSGEAHNNLGGLYLTRHELYLAAWEFERASELMPESHVPLINLGMVFEEAGQPDLAIDYYRHALAITPQNPTALGNLARVYIKEDGDPEMIRMMLQHLVFIDSRPDWIGWAEELLATRYRSDAPRTENAISELPNQAPSSTREVLPRASGSSSQTIEDGAAPNAGSSGDDSPRVLRPGRQPSDSKPVPLPSPPDEAPSESLPESSEAVPSEPLSGPYLRAPR